MEFKVMLIQPEIKSDQFNEEIKKANLTQIVNLIEQGAPEKPDLVVLPDEFLSGYGYGPLNLPMILENDVFPVLGDLARKYGLFIAGAAQDAVTFTTSHSTGFILNPEGRVLGMQNRIFTYPDEEHFVIPGSQMELIETPFGKGGFLIGLDLLHPELARELVSKGAEWIIAPVYAFSEKIKINEYCWDYPGALYRISAQARAMENNIWVIFANGVGQHSFAERPLFGGSMIISPYGPVCEMNSMEGIGMGRISTAMFRDFYIEPLQ